MALLQQATRQLFSVLLRRIEGFNDRDNKSNVIVIGATNRKEDLDSAFISRFDLSIHFGLPDGATRKDIFKRSSSLLFNRRI